MSVSGRSTAPKPPSADDEGFKRELVQLIPHLRAFARTLTGDPTAADDLAQDAMMKAWDARASYQMGTNMKAWTFMILRNQFYTAVRKSNRLVPWEPEAAERLLVQEPEQEARIHLEDVEGALSQLPHNQREMLLLVAGAGMTYEEAALHVDCKLGTVKSRINRGRAAMRAIIDGADAPC